MELTRLGLKSIALAMLQYIHHNQTPEITFAAQHLQLEAAAWYNGREAGVVLYTFKQAWAFSEAKRTDEIFVDTFTVKHGTMNPPTTRDMSDEEYSNRKHFAHEEIGRACEYIILAISEHLTELNHVAILQPNNQ